MYTNQPNYMLALDRISIRIRTLNRNYVDAPADARVRIEAALERLNKRYNYLLDKLTGKLRVA